MEPTNKATGLLTSDTLINDGQAVLAGAHIVTDGSNDATVVLYDNTSAAGTEVFKQIVNAADDSIPYTLPQGGIKCKTGLYLDITGTNAACIIFYR